MKKLILLLFLISKIIYSQKVPQPKVGLVLSGGGAKGFAHIGVLKELEKSGVKVDYIAGTSMGAIIGGLYASGYSANQIEEIVNNTDFESLMVDKIPRKYKPYFHKKYHEKTALTLPIKKGKLELPLGLSKGQQMLNMLTNLLYPVQNVKNFSKLPTPFFCIATDVETGKEVVLNKGNLALALRASGSYPSLLNPVEIDGKMLIDGGVVDNFPVKKLKEKGLDIIIGVSVQGKLHKKEEITSALAILDQIVSFQMYKDFDKQIKKVDIYLQPKVLNYNVISFDKSKEIIEAGVKEAQLFKKEFELIAKLQKRKPKPNKVKLENKKFVVNKINITGNKNYTKSYILGMLHLRKKDSITQIGISEKIDRLSATNNFERIDFNLKNTKKGKELNLNVVEDNYKSSVGLGVHYDNLYRSGLLINYNHKKLLLNDELIIDLIIGDKVRYNLNYYINNGIYLSYGLSSRFQYFSSNMLYNKNNINKISVDYSDFTNRLYVQTTLNRKFALGFGVEHKKLLISSETLVNKDKGKTYFDDTNYVNSYAFLNLDTFDKRMFPTKGFNIDADFTWYMFSDRNNRLNNFYHKAPFNQYFQVKGSFSFVKTFFNKLTFQNTYNLGLTLGKQDLEIFDYKLGGYNKNYINNFIPFYGYEMNGLSNKSFLKSALEVRYQIFKKNYITLNANYVRINDNFLNKFELFKNLKSGYSVGYGLETFLGPIEVKYSWSPDHKQKFWSFNLGFWF